MDNKYQKSIDMLNKATGLEIATSLQYMYFHVHCEELGYRYLAEMFHRISIAEMHHIEEFSERILFLGGDVEMNPSFRTLQVTDVNEMLKMAMELEQNTVENYNEWAKLSCDNKDAGTRQLFVDTIAEEESHLDRFRTEFDNMKAYGENYLLLQSIAESKHANKE